MAMADWLAVAAGGATGALLRFASNDAMTRAVGSGFPWGILLVNVVGSMAMGVLYVLLSEQELLPGPWRMALTVGLLGAFTTFSTFSLQAVQLLESGRLLAALAYCMGSVVLCVGSAFAGVLVTRAFAN